MTFLLAHLSDPHIGPLPVPRRRELLGKRLTGYLNWQRGRSTAHDMETLGRLVADLKSHHPDHIAVTGDILNLGLAAEFPLGRLWLESLGQPENVSFVPGNHDAYVRGALPDLARTFKPWTAGEHPLGESLPFGQSMATALYPYLRRRGPVALIGLASGVPMPPFIASGRLGRQQLAGAETLLKEAAAQNCIRVIMLHHPPWAEGKFGRGLVDARPFAEMIGRVGAELILHGHEHRPSVTYLTGPKGRRVPIVGVPSASLVRGSPYRYAAYHLFAIEGTGAEPRIKASAWGLLADGKTIGDRGAVPV
ncbi:metallophosphoesterase family protein [Beijerinckia indica]|uniref:Metallophosphoesterase n=1 Tax=Beijerinckia indica subsp. indica (strain ATCC 9039 / DSM 1715 / NCIMB 8712) TaxID=395963 RepID=B2IEQ9_BEII9|nr:metallophosphoesterase [Beijerinckia indica]ACB96999.1 metallophosphoesterase [Beijerinckia indica subsp. indica ATCC 9039]